MALRVSACGASTHFQQRDLNILIDYFPQWFLLQPPRLLKPHATIMERTSTNSFLPQDSVEKRKSQATPKKEIWSSLLNSVSSGRRLPEKQLILLGMFIGFEFVHVALTKYTGGTPESQKEFLESLSPEPATSRKYNSKKPPVANQYALGYTYQDVMDADQAGRNAPFKVS